MTSQNLVKRSGSQQEGTQLTKLKVQMLEKYKIHHKEEDTDENSYGERMHCDATNPTVSKMKKTEDVVTVNSTKRYKTTRRPERTTTTERDKLLEAKYPEKVNSAHGVGHYPVAGWLRVACAYIQCLTAKADVAFD